MNEWNVYFPFKHEYFCNKEQLDNTIEYSIKALYNDTDLYLL